MLSISIGPFAMSVPLFTTLAGITIFWALSHWLTRKDAENTHTVNGVFWAVVIGFVSARFAFVIKLWSVYQENWWQIINIRDGGFIPYFGWIAALFVLVVSSRGKRPMTRAYLRASIAAMCVVVPLNLAVRFYSADLVIPQIPVFDSSGAKFSLQTFKGKPLVINYWATWCPPCRREMPVLEAAQKQHSSVTFLLINQGEDSTTAERFLNSQDLDLQNVFYDPASQLSRASGAAGLPTTLFFDASGKLVANHMGELSRASLTNYLRKLNEYDTQKTATQ